MHDQITHGTLFNSFGHSRFRATSCTLQFLYDKKVHSAPFYLPLIYVFKCGQFSR
ncbi:hypothetical protein HMPREF9065_01169 [Aggregatibacter sp. oral taxon 458 str. W10330]|nr:hypothetical protein HMPREF9065_01169 [Aggregatibacter sp. oral taxon 458 str. W10330]